MFGTYFYHEHIKRTVAVFGTLFNNIKVVKTDGSGKVLSTIKVPLSYGPRQKVLARIADEKYLNDPKLAIRLPRMSFEIISLTYDTTSKLQKGLTRKVPSENPLQSQSILYPTTYRIGLSLNVMAKNQDDALQILEQILPYFQPEYTVTVKEIDNNFKADIPFVLQAVTMTDDYEGDFISRRSIIYTLEFEAKVRFYGPLQSKSIIKTSSVSISDPSMTSAGYPYSSQSFSISPANAGPDDTYEIIGTYNQFGIPESIKIFYTSSVGTFVLGDKASGAQSLAVGTVSNVGTGFIISKYPDANYQVGETVTNGKGATLVVSRLEPLYKTLDIGFFEL